MKKTTIKETEATYDDKLAMIMAVGDATIEEASRALEECRGNIDRALALVYDQAPPPKTRIASSSSSLHNAPYKPSKTARRMEDVDDESIAKPSESLRHAPTLVARRQPFVAAAAAPKGPKENVFHAPHQPTTTSPSVASANQNACTFNQTTTNAIPTRDSPLHAPGAFAVYGPSDVAGRHDDDNFTYTQQTVSVVNNAPIMPTEPVEAHLVDNADDVENLQEQLRRRDEALQRREEELERIQRRQENIVVGQVLGVRNNDGDDEEKAEEIHSNKEDPSFSSNNKSMCASKRKVTIAVVAVLVIVAVIVGVVVAMLLKSAESKPPPTDDLSPVNSPTDATEIPATSPMASPTPTTMDDWTNSCDVSSNSLAKRLPCVSQDETYLFLSENSLTGTIPSQLGLLTKLTELDLSLNILMGTIPSEVGLMSNLSSLNLWGNSLTGTIPSQIALLSKLADFDLYDNLLMGTIPSEAGLLTKLTWLSLYYNSLTGTIPSQIALLSNLSFLSLSGNNFTGTIPSQIGSLTHLDTLHLDQNSLTGTIPSTIGQLTKLTQLHLYDNNFTGEFTCPAFIDDCWISCDYYETDTYTEACRSL